ncbi:MAG: hypothetical protein ACQEXX_01560 [Bacillota bacterium]
MWISKGDRMRMVEQLECILNIDQSAVELIAMIGFIFAIPSDFEQLLRDCSGKSGKDINKYVYDMRLKRIGETRYPSKRDFINHFQSDKKAALQRLFQEPLNKAKLSKLCIDDPDYIFEIHSRQHSGIRFMKFLLFV